MTKNMNYSTREIAEKTAKSSGFRPFDISQEILKMAAADKKFAKAWADSRNESALIHELIKLRKENHLTQKELAKMVGTTQQVISRFEHKENDTKLSTFLKIANSLGCQVVLKKSN